MNLLRNLRLIPVVALAAAALFFLKVSAIVIEGGYTLASLRVAQAQGLGEGVRATDFKIPPPAPLDDTTPAVRGDRARSWVRDLYEPADVTGSVAAKPEAAPPPAAAAPDKAAQAPAATPAKGEAPPAEAASAPPADAIKPTLTAGERAILESLQQRRQELDTRAREIEVRDSLVKAAEKRVEQRLQELKETEARITGVATKKDEAEAAKFKSLVSMYENMKAKDAAKVFDRLNMRVLIEVVNTMNPRRMSDILGQMTPEVAERLTIEIANRSGAIDKGPPQPVELPKIEGRPTKS